MFKAINAYELGKNRKKDFRLFLLAFLLFVAYGLFFQFRRGWYSADCYVTTLLSMSYLKDGFFRRGLVGTLYDIVCRVIPAAFGYKGAVWFMWGMNLVYYAALLVFVKWMLGKIEDNAVYKGAYFFSMICFAFMVPTACYCSGALGRADLLQMAICLLQIGLLITQRAEWLTLPLTAVNVLFHEGYVIMTFCTVLIVLFYRTLYAGEKRGRYWLLLALNVIVCGIMALLSVMAAPAANAGNYERVYGVAESLSSAGKVHYNLIYMMTGYMPENAPVILDAQFIETNLRELPVFLVCFIPALIVWFRGVLQLFKQAGKERVFMHIAAILLGPALIGVEYARYCDYGRYIFWLVFYFFTMFLSLAVMGDKGAKGALEKAYGFKNTVAILVIALMMPYQPIPTCYFTKISHWLAPRLGF